MDMKIKRGQILKELRLNKRLSQQNIADVLKVSARAYQKYEYGTAEPNFDTLSKLADFYGVTADYLLGREPKKEQPIDYEEVKRKTNEIIERIENLPPEHQAFMIKIVHVLSGMEQEVSAELQPVVKKPEIQQNTSKSPLTCIGKEDDADEYITYTTTIGAEMDRRKAIEAVQQAGKLDDAETKKNAV